MSSFLKTSSKLLNVSKRGSSSTHLGSAEEDKGISTPSNVKHNLHVDLNFNWSGEDDPGAAFKIVKKVGIGRRAYGDVFKAVHTETGLQVAIKTVRAGKKSKGDEIRKEIEVLKKCRHQNIVSYFGCCWNKKELWILMDYCAIGSVADLISDNDDKPIKLPNIKEEQIASIMACVLKGIAYLHEKAIIHRDIKSANILLNDKAEPKLADFGVASQLGEVSSALSIVGSPLWMSPEVIAGVSHNASADIWSIGITAIEIAEGVPPHHEDNVMRAMYKIGSGPPPSLKSPSKYSDVFNQFIAVCLNKDPLKRPTAHDLLSHPFIAKAKPPASVLTSVLEQSYELQAQEQASLELWTLNLRIADVAFKTTLLGGMMCSEAVKKVCRKLPNIRNPEEYALFYVPDQKFLEDEKKLAFYYKWRVNGGINLELKLRKDTLSLSAPSSPPSRDSPSLSSHRSNSSPELVSRLVIDDLSTGKEDDVEMLKSTIQSLEIQLTAEKHKNKQLENEKALLVNELSEVKKQLQELTIKSD